MSAFRFRCVRLKERKRAKYARNNQVPFKMQTIGGSGDRLLGGKLDHSTETFSRKLFCKRRLNICLH